MANPPYTSEDAFIAHFLAPLAANAAGALGLKDDAAWITPRPGHDLVVTTDTLVEGVHFLFDGTAEEARAIACKAIAVNVSDLVAKGAKPESYLLALTLPKDRPTDVWFSGFALGLADAQSRWSLNLLGGDTTRHPTTLSISITAFGTVPSGRMVTRAGAKPGDRIYVSGTIGDALPGLVLRQGGEPAAFMTAALDPATSTALLARYQTPEPPVALGPAVLGYASAAMDVSDGIALDLSRLASASGAGAEVHLAKIPFSAAIRKLLAMKRVSPQDLLSCGDDYEILATVPPHASSAFEAAASKASIAVTNIGIIRAKPGLDILERDDQPMAFSRLGYDHFSGK